VAGYTLPDPRNYLILYFGIIILRKVFETLEIYEVVREPQSRRI
jgi:hypothetical protein